MIDVKNKKCIYKLCKIQPYYNYKGNKNGIFCFEHKKPGMINVKDKKCIYELCKKQPCFNYKENKNGIFCSEHKK